LCETATHDVMPGIVVSSKSSEVLRFALPTLIGGLASNCALQFEFQLRNDRIVTCRNLNGTSCYWNVLF